VMVLVNLGLERVATIETFIKGLVDDGVILPEYIPTYQVLADKVTKPFGGSKILWSESEYPRPN
jgi:hypothetical protein